MFRSVERCDGGMSIKLTCPSGDDMPGVVLRVHAPSPKHSASFVSGVDMGGKDQPVYGDLDTVVPIRL